MPSTTALSLADRRKIGQVRVLPGCLVMRTLRELRLQRFGWRRDRAQVQSRPRAVEQEIDYGLQLNFCGADTAVRTEVSG
jgi:hypothetical protein